MTFLGASVETLSGGDIALDSITHDTVVYNEAIQAFEQFSDCKPALWLETDGKLLTSARQDETSVSYLPGGDIDVSFVDPRNKGYLQYEGEKNNFYGTVYPSTLELIINPQADMTAIFDNIEYKGEIFINDVDQSNLTLDTIQVLNDHQDSGVITIAPDDNAQRRFRSWRMNIPRDTASNQPRMRDYYVKLILTHTPGDNERMVLHDIITKVRPGSH
jgi:hypothetical protein